MLTRPHAAACMRGLVTGACRWRHAACDCSTHVRLNSSRFMDTGVTLATSALFGRSMAACMRARRGWGWQQSWQAEHTTANKVSFSL